MMASLPPKMSVQEYRSWTRNPCSRDASKKSFFPAGVNRTINVLSGDATRRSMARWYSFGSRHYAQYKKKPTYRRAVALRNWGFRVPVPPGKCKKREVIEFAQKTTKNG